MSPLHIFLTGEVGVGKSALINRVLAAHPLWQVGGFRTLTEKAQGADSPRAVYIVPAGRPGLPCTPGNTIGLRGAGGRLACYPANFDSQGVLLLQDSRGSGLILMDELGTMENAAPLFQRSVFGVLAGDAPVLGVLQGKASPFLDALRARRDVRLLPLTREGQQDTFDQVTRLLCQQIRSG
ncbi:MAG: nucleoside-triphosphatase [Christensenellales bacterium]